jgi:hypothetical protein
MALRQRLRLQPLDRPHDPLPQGASVALAGDQEIAGAGRGLVGGIASTSG